jgi:hypothetical protein
MWEAAERMTIRRLVGWVAVGMALLGILTGLLGRWYETIAAAVVVVVCTIFVARREE